MNNEKNVDTLIEVVRSQIGIISELQTALTFSDYQNVKTENELKSLNKQINQFVVENGISNGWNLFKQGQDCISKGLAFELADEEEAIYENN